MDADLALRRVVTPDGVEIAYHVLGEGPPLLCLFPYHGSDFRLEWAVPVHRRGLRYLSNSFTVINLDMRGTGSSQRKVSDLSFDLLSLDICAVLGALGYRQASIMALGNAALIAAYFAAHFPSSVDRLLLFAAGDSEVHHRLAALRLHHVNVEADLRATVLGGLRDPLNTEALATVFREAVDPSALHSFETLLDSTDLSAFLPRVTAPTLFVSASEDGLMTSESARLMATLIPGAVFRAFPGTSPLAIWRNPAAMQTTVQFLRGSLSDEVSNTRHGIRSDPGSTRSDSLTEREKEVLDLLAQGMTNQQISQELFISLNTVRHHVKNIFLKTHTSNRTEAASFAHRVHHSI